MYKTVSVQLPTYNRRATLEKCLQALFHQDYPHELMEIIVVDDGSTDGTDRYLVEVARISPIAMKYFRQNNEGSARARNRGIMSTDKDIILMTDDDVIADFNLVNEHLEWHNRYFSERVAILGYVTWSPEVKVTDFMWWCENGGPLTRYYRITDQLEVDFGHFYTGNISLKRTFLQRNLFDPGFHFGFDDLELGYRLYLQGLKIIYNKKAVGYHFATYDIVRLEKRLVNIAESAIILHRKWPELQKKVGRPRPMLVLRLAKLMSVILYPLARILKWKKVIYRFRYQNRLSIAYARAYHANAR